MKNFVKMSLTAIIILGSSGCDFFNTDSMEENEPSSDNCKIKTSQSKLSQLSEYKLSTYEYDGSNRLSRCYREDGLFDFTYAYNSSGELSEIIQKTESFGNVVYFKLDYENDNDGPTRIVKSKSMNGVDYVMDLSYQFEYSDGQLTSSSIWEDGEQLTSCEFDYGPNSEVSQMRIFYFDGEENPTRSNEFNFTYGEDRDINRIEFWKDLYEGSSSVIENSGKEVTAIVARNYENGILNSSGTTSYEYVYNEDNCLIEEVVTLDNGSQNKRTFSY